MRIGSPSMGMAHPTGLGQLAQSYGWIYEGGYVLLASDGIRLQILVPVYVCLPEVILGYFLIQKLSPYRGTSFSVPTSSKERRRHQECLGTVHRGEFNSLNMFSYYSQGSSESPLP